MTTRYNSISRRAFLATTSAAGLALTTTATHAGSRVRAGLIGFGDLGSELYRETLDATLPLDVVAVSDVDDQRFAVLPATVGRTNRWSSIVEASDIDAVLIATPDHTLTPPALAALEAGKHVFLVPPFAHDYTAISALRTAAQRGGGRLHLATDLHAQHHWDSCRDAYGQVDHSAPRWIEADIMTQPNRPDGHWSFGAATGRGDEVTVLLNHFRAATAAFSLGLPKRAIAFGGVFTEPLRETPDSISFYAEYEGGLRLTLNVRPAPTQARTTLIRGRSKSVALPAPTAKTALDLAFWAKGLDEGTATSIRAQEEERALLEILEKAIDPLVGPMA